MEKTRCAVKLQCADVDAYIYVLPDVVTVVAQSEHSKTSAVVYLIDGCIIVVEGTPEEVMSKLGIPIQPE